MAKQRLLSTEKKLLKNKVAVAYQQVLTDYLDKQYIRQVPKEEAKPTQEWLLPHFPVIRPERTSTKVRIVFDGSAPFEGKSLNTEALPGPKLQSNIFDILVKFRKGTVALAGDISQMYHQLVLPEEDRSLRRFLRRNLDLSKEPEVYEFLRYCPFCAQYTWQQHAQINEEEYPLSANAVKKQCYMDDVMPSVDSADTAKETRRQLSEMGDKAGFHICKWVSNRTEVLEDIPDNDRSSKVSLETNMLPITKTLGMRWDAGDDKFLFDYSSPDEDFHYKKRNVLKKTASLFEPLGIIAPFVVKAKLYLQQAWLESLDWDDELPEKLKNDWKNWFTELHFLRKIKIQRCLKNNNPVTIVTLHSFSDACEKAYAAAVYSRHEYEDKSITTQLISSKTRLPLLKAISIPRLELMGALIGVLLTKQISAALEIPMKDATFWVDSMNVFHWIHGRSRDYKPFVAHRVGEIHHESCPVQWKYVPTELNPADFGSQGMNVSEIKNSEQWWFRPEFLKKPKEEWPEEKIERETHSETQKEMKFKIRKQESVFSNEQSSSFIITTQEQHVRLMDVSRYSKWYRVNVNNKLEFGLSLVRVRCWIHRFIYDCQLRKEPEKRVRGELTAEELHQTEEKFIQEAQYESYPDEIDALERNKCLLKKSSILTFTPKLTDGLLRSNTRLSYAENLPDRVRYPIILPKKHPVTKLIIKYHHEKEGHQVGLNYTMNHLRERYIIVHARETVKRIIRECNE